MTSTTSIMPCWHKVRPLSLRDIRMPYEAEDFFNKMENMDPLTFDIGFQYLRNKTNFVVQVSKDFHVLVQRCRLDLGRFNGGTVMNTAATFGNSPLIRHLHELDYQQIYYGDINGATPLFNAVKYKKNDAVETLIELGANVNIALTQEIIDYTALGESTIPIGATCLWVALEKSKSVFLTRLLLKFGGAYQLPLSEEGKKILEQATTELAKERTQIAKCISNSLENFPTDLIGMIRVYV